MNAGHELIRTALKFKKKNFILSKKFEINDKNFIQSNFLLF